MADEMPERDNWADAVTPEPTMGDEQAQFREALRAFADAPPIEPPQKGGAGLLSWGTLRDLRGSASLIWPIIGPVIVRTVRPFVLPKIGFVAISAAALFVKGRRAIPLLLAAAALTDVLWAAVAARRELQTGGARRRVAQGAGLRVGLGLLCDGLLALGLWALPLWAALVIAAPLIALFGLLYIAARLYLQFRVWTQPTTQPVTEAGRIYAQIRRRVAVADAAAALRARQGSVTDPAIRRDDAFYLGWAETYLGHTAFAAGDLDGATAHYRAALAADPQNVAARLLLAVVLARAGNSVGAVAALERAGAVLRGKERDEPLGTLHIAEVTGETQQAIATVQACGLVLVTLDSETAADVLFAVVAALPGQSVQALADLFRSRVGRSLGALLVLAAGPSAAPDGNSDADGPQPGASALDLLRDILTLPAPSPRIAVRLSQRTTP